jgi:anti-sigma28 factor (negative regulator of flagellin synthesis)
MRLQLDSSVTGAGDAGQAAAVGGAGSNSRRVGYGGSGGQDSIQISGASSALNTFSSDRAARIAQLTTAVQNGSYQVSSSAVSRAIVDQAFA